MKFAAAILLLIFTAAPVSLNTWSIAAVDPRTGDVGVAGASCVDLYVDAIGALVPGKGAGVAQALWDLDNRNRLFAYLQEGKSADETLKRLIDPAEDNGVVDRQYGVVTFNKDGVNAVGYTGKDAMTWAGSKQDRAKAVSVQGNILAGPAVVDDAMKAFLAQSALPDALMSALEAGSAAGGDTRCNRQTASAAFILVARAGDKPYAARDLGVSDEGKAGAPWLALSVREPRNGANPVRGLRVKFDAWKKRQGN